MNAKRSAWLRRAGRCIAVGAAATAVAFPCSAADWALVATDEGRGGVSIYGDNAGIRQEGAVIKVWTLWDFLTPQYDGVRTKRYSSARVLYAVNCKNNTQAIVQITMHKGAKGAGEVVSTHAYKPDELEYEETSPDSVAQEIQIFACAHEAIRQPKKTK
jgi:hypothetical protein